ALAGLKVSHADIQALIDKGYFMTAYQQCVDKGYSDDKAKILDFFHQQVDTLEKGIPEGAKVTEIKAGRFPSEKIEMPDGITVFRKNLALLKGNEMDPRLPLVDELNFKISDYLKLNLVPPTEARSSRVYQLFVSEARTGKQLGYPSWAIIGKQHPRLSKEYPELGKLAVWDVLTGQEDRMAPDNWLVSESGNLIAIDNSESLREDSAFYPVKNNGDVNIRFSDLGHEQFRRFFTNPDTLEKLENVSELADQFTSWAKDKGFTDKDVEDFSETLIENSSGLLEEAKSISGTEEEKQQYSQMLEAVDQNTLKARYKHFSGQPAAQTSSCK
ncbi:MAG: hypothetical protein ACR2PT_03655, partial [Endozoicomonas sp.]